MYYFILQKSSLPQENKQNHTELCSLFKFSQNKNKKNKNKNKQKIHNLQNSTVFLPFQHFYTSWQLVQSITSLLVQSISPCAKTKSPTQSKSRLLSCRLFDFIKVNVAQHDNLSALRLWYFLRVMLHVGLMPLELHVSW